MILILLCFSALLIANDLPDVNTFSFGVIGHAFRTVSDEIGLSTAIDQMDDKNLAFVVKNESLVMISCTSNGKHYCIAQKIA
ncbi:MAG: hypothetical protein H7240_06750 [Glaciimonas sp.]|nr:hypothetical protein [Glaciimonas sp.]